MTNSCDTVVRTQLHSCDSCNKSNNNQNIYIMSNPAKICQLIKQTDNK